MKDYQKYGLYNGKLYDTANMKLLAENEYNKYLKATDETYWHIELDDGEVMDIGYIQYENLKRAIFHVFGKDKYEELFGKIQVI